MNIINLPQIICYHAITHFLHFQIAAHIHFNKFISIPVILGVLSCSPSLEVMAGIIGIIWGWCVLRHINISFFSTSHWFFSFRARFSLSALIVFIINSNFLFFYLLRVTSDIVLLKQFPICFLCLISCSTLSTIMNTIFIWWIVLKVLNNQARLITTLMI